MGNIPAKLTGKYQSYDINTPAQVTPPITVRKSNGNFVYQDHEHMRKSFSSSRGNGPVAPNYDTFNFKNSNFQSNSFDHSYQYAFQRQQQIDVPLRRMETHTSNSVDDDDDEDERHNGSYGRGERDYDGGRERLVNERAANVSDSVNSSNTSQRRLNAGVRLEQVEDDSSDVEHQDHQNHQEDEDEDEEFVHQRRGGGDRFKYDDVEHENEESGIDSKRTDRDEDSTSKDHEDDFSNHSISVSIINEKGIDIMPSDYCQHGGKFTRQFIISVNSHSSLNSSFLSSPRFPRGPFGRRMRKGAREIGTQDQSHRRHVLELVTS